VEALVCHHAWKVGAIRRFAAAAEIDFDETDSGAARGGATGRAGGLLSSPMAETREAASAG
jgi:hypothetical protein